MRDLGPGEYDEWVLENDSHAWAFYHYCKRRGDMVRAFDDGDTVRIRIYDYAED